MTTLLEQAIASARARVPGLATGKPWEDAMYASVRRYRIDPKNMDELVQRIPGALDVMSSFELLPVSRTPG